MDIQNIENRVPFREQIKKVSNNKCVFGFTIASFITSFSIFIYLLATPEKIVYNNVGGGNSLRPTIIPTMVPTMEPSIAINNVILFPTIVPKFPTGLPTIKTPPPSGTPTMYPTYKATTVDDVV
jgi:hypothetical protein